MKKYILYILLLSFIAFPVVAQVRPSYHQGFYSRQRGGIPLNPNLWKGLIVGVHAGLGVTGNKLRDITGFNNHGILNNMDGSNWVVEKEGYTLGFDGSGESVNIPAHANQELTELTVLIKVKRNGPTLNNDRCFEKEFDNAGSSPFISWGFEWEGNESLSFHIGTTLSIHSLTGPVLTDDTFTALAGTYSDVTSESNMYIEGALFNTLGSITGVITYSASNKDLHIFGRTGLGQYAPGSLLYGYVYNRILSVSEIRQHSQDDYALFRTRRILVKPPAAPAPTGETTQVIIISQLFNQYFKGFEFLYN